MKRYVSVVGLIVATWNNGPPASQPFIEEMPGSVANGTPYINNTNIPPTMIINRIYETQNLLSL